MEFIQNRIKSLDISSSNAWREKSLTVFQPIFVFINFLEILEISEYFRRFPDDIIVIQNRLFLFQTWRECPSSLYKYQSVYDVRYVYYKHCLYVHKFV